MRLEHLLVGDGRANPVPKNRSAGGGLGLKWSSWRTEAAASNAASPKVICEAKSGDPEIHSGQKRRALPEVEGLLE